MKFSYHFVLFAEFLNNKGRKVIKFLILNSHSYLTGMKLLISKVQTWRLRRNKARLLLRIVAFYVYYVRKKFAQFVSLKTQPYTFDSPLLQVGNKSILVLNDQYSQISKRFGLVLLLTIKKNSPDYNGLSMRIHGICVVNTKLEILEAVGSLTLRALTPSLEMSKGSPLHEYTHKCPKLAASQEHSTGA